MGILPHGDCADSIVYNSCDGLVFLGGIPIQKNKITIGTGKKDKQPEKEYTGRAPAENPSSAEPAPGVEPEAEQEPLYENVWGNDTALYKQLDEQTLAEKRLYVRVRCMQSLECSSMSRSRDMELAQIAPPLKLTMIDISMGGIGVICDEPLKDGINLAFTVTLDNIKYDVVYEVVYCIKMDEKYRVGLKLARKDKAFTHHLKVYVARISLTSRYGQSGKS